MIARIQIGWVWLERTLNRIIDAINANQPLASSSIAIEQSPNGTVLRVVKSQDQQPPQGAGGGGGQQQPAQQVIWHNVSWKTVTVVDPVSCAQSQIVIPVQTTGGQIIIQ